MSRLRKLFVFFGICSLPFLIIVAVNEIPNNPDRSHQYTQDRCTWYCHDVTCKHWKDSYKEEPTLTKKVHKDIFSWYVKILHNNVFGFNYGLINLIVFFGVYPLLGSWLLWRLIKRII